MITIRVPSPLMIDLRIHDYNAHQFPLLCLNNDDNVVCKSDLYFDDGGKIWTAFFLHYADVCPNYDVYGQYVILLGRGCQRTVMKIFCGAVDGRQRFLGLIVVLAY